MGTFLRLKFIFLFLICFVYGVSAFASDPAPHHDRYSPDQLNPELQALAKDFFAWRMKTQPITPDDVPRVQRPDGWVPDWSPAFLEEMQSRYESFRKCLQGLDGTHWSRVDSIDFLLLRSAIERVNWELNVLKLPFRNPDFYVQQTVGAFYDLLILSSPMTPQRAGNLILRLKSIPVTMGHARQNLTDPAAPFAKVALANLTDIRNKMKATGDGLESVIPKQLHESFKKAVEDAASALEATIQWLESRLPSMSQSFAIGREAYDYFLKRIAMIPYSPEELVRQGHGAFQLAASLEILEQNRNEGAPPLPMAKFLAEMTERARQDENAIRLFLENKNLMTVPDRLSHYLLRELPDYLAPLAHIGGAYDLTWETRLKEDAVRYVPEPSPEMPYFYRSMAMDPRPVIIHEGVPGHYFQMAISWQHPDPIRRRYIDSGANEGIGFYVEELMLQSGMFDDSPRVREILTNFMRLRALRVEVDVRLALGEFSIEDAGSYLESTVPMDHGAAVEEARFFARTPCQAITYQIGKLQILKFLADSKTIQLDAFDLRNFHDFIILNGNVPIALQRWELLGLRDEISIFWKD